MQAGERGAGSILVVGVLAAMLSLSAVSVPLYSVLLVKRQLGGAADAAALAAADVAVGRAAGIPCAVAEQVATANGAALTACEPDGLVVTVRVGARVLGFSVSASATAGPAASSG